MNYRTNFVLIITAVVVTGYALALDNCATRREILERKIQIVLHSDNQPKIAGLLTEFNELHDNSTKYIFHKN